MKTISLKAPLSFISILRKHFSTKGRFMTMLKTGFIALAVSLLFSTILSAKTVEPSVAAAVAKNFYKSTSKGASFSGGVNLSPVNGISESSILVNAHLLYVFNVNQSDGFVLVAGDDAVLPILGYSENGSFDYNNLPDNFAKWLEGYKHEIMFAINNELKATDLIKNQWKSLKAGKISFNQSRSGVPPLLTTTWNQSPNYNAFCPGGSVTGCVATAMAQVMNYWEFPIKGSGYHFYNENDYGILFANFGATHYKWLDMPDDLTGPNESVATLMYHCGVSVDMDYSPSASGAKSSPIPYAFKTYFGYDRNLSLRFKDNYTTANWNSLMIAELEAARPIFYAGHSTNVGHAFVCDGYLPFQPDNELFHINWGWGGAYDGYFVLSNLAPTGTGIGGGTPTAKGYNSGQLAVIGVQPDPQGPPSLQMLDSPFVVDTIFNYGETYYVVGNIRNTGFNAFEGKIAAAVFDRKNDELVAFLDSTDVSIAGSGGIGIGDYSGATTVLPGFYYISYLYKASNSDNWVQIENTLATNRTNIIIIDESGGTEILYLFEAPSISSNTLMQNIPFTIEAKLGNLFVIPSWSGDVAAELYSMDFDYLQTIEVKPNITINIGNIDVPISFSSSGLNVPPGPYQIVLRAKKSNGSIWWFPLALEGVSSTTTVHVLPPPIAPDPYESNNELSSAYTLNSSFTDDQATVNTQSSNMHVPEDYDFYKIDLPEGYDYHITPRIHDSYTSTNVETYTNDVRFLYAINGGPFSESFDDVPFPTSFTLQGENTIHFRVNPYYLGTVGTYLLDINISRTETTGVDDPLAEDVFKVYPNPADDYIMVELLEQYSEAKSMNLHGIDGQLVFSDRIYPDKKNHISTHDLPDGFYILTVITGKSISSKKVSILH